MATAPSHRGHGNTQLSDDAVSIFFLFVHLRPRSCKLSSLARLRSSASATQPGIIVEQPFQSLTKLLEGGAGALPKFAASRPMPGVDGAKHENRRRA